MSPLLLYILLNLHWSHILSSMLYSLQLWVLIFPLPPFPFLENDLHQDNDKLHLNLLELEVSGDPWASAEAVQECVMRALAAPLAPHTKILLSQRGLQFTEDYSNSVERWEFTANILKQASKPSSSESVSYVCSVLSVYEAHQKLLNDLGGTKRGAENGWEGKEPLMNE